MRRLLLPALLLGLPLAPSTAQTAPVAEGVPVIEGTRFIWSGTGAGDFLGWCVALAVVPDAPDTVALPPPGPLALGGAPGFPGNTAYLFRETAGTWAQVQRLDPDIGGVYGVACAITPDGTLAVVGAPMREDPPASPAYSGAAHVFRYDADSGVWTQEAALRVAALSASRLFGQGVAVARDGTGAAATEERILALGGGRAWVLRRANAPDSLWTEEGRLEPVPASGDTFFGNEPLFGAPHQRASILYGSDGAWRAMAGGPYTIGSTARGSAYIWRLDGGVWVQEARLVGTDGECLGNTVALAETGGVWLAAVGVTQGCSGNGVGLGRVEVWRLDGGVWVREASLPQPDPSGEHFGGNVALWAGTDGHAVLLGSQQSWSGVGTSGTYVFERTASGAGGAGVWAYAAKLAIGPPWGDQAVALVGGHALVGQKADDVIGMNAGVLIAYDLSGVLTAAEPPGQATGAAAVSVWPNPAAGVAVVRLVLPAAGTVRVSLHDVLGREAAVVHDGVLPAGPSRLAFDVSGLAAGVYVIRVLGAGLAASRTVTVAR